MVLRHYGQQVQLTNRRKDIRHKLVSTITNNYRYVCFQDESVHAWSMSGHGKKVQFSGIGSILADLKHKAVAPLEVNRFFPSTKLCPKCGKKNQITLENRLYQCSCGFKMDRDTKSAICIEAEGLKQIPMEHRKFTPAETQTTTFYEQLSKINGIVVSKSESVMQEDPTL